jgi:DegV family protein with EDD domain
MDMAICAKQLADEGKTVDEIFAALEEKTNHSFSFLYPDNFKQLSRSGRLSPMAARMASMLKIKALLCLDEQGKAVDKYTMARTEVKILKSIVDKFHELGVNAKQHKIYISHADNEIFAKKAKLLFQTTFHGIDVEINYLPAVLTCHGGLACCAIHTTYKI